MLHITEDTPADMLSGAMDLDILLPSGKTIKMCIERSTPMMDLLVQITTNNQLQITNYLLQPIETTSEKNLSYYPNTPIGTLDTKFIKVISKTTKFHHKNIQPGHQPFESTFRLKVHLPRNQLYVTRVSRHVLIEDILKKVCEEKNLDPNKYEARHPGNQNESLDQKLTLNDYMITEIHLMLKNTNVLHSFSSSSNDVILRKEEERKQLHNKTGGGVFNLIFKRNKTNKNNSFSSAISSIFHKDTSSTTMKRPVSEPISISINKDLQKQPQEQPKAPQRKRRPAPKPPQVNEIKKDIIIDDEEEVEEQVEMRIKENLRNINENLTICHSRHSSDSSGYHETSYLSDQCNTSLPRFNNRLKDLKNLRRHTSDNINGITSRSRSTPSLVIIGRKKKAAPSPPTLPEQKPLDKPSPVVASLTSISLLPSKIDNEDDDELTLTNLEIKQISPIKEPYIEDIIEELPSNDNFANQVTILKELNDDYKKLQQDSGNSSDISEKSKKNDDYEEEDDLDEDIQEINVNEWQVPSPPKAFKDTPKNDNLINNELITKLKEIENEENDDNIEENQLIFNKLSLENLEKRRSLVYNRELATSLKLYNQNDLTDELKSYTDEVENCTDEVENYSDDVKSCSDEIKSYSVDIKSLTDEHKILTDDSKNQSDKEEVPEISKRLNKFDKMLENIRKNNEINNKTNDIIQSTLPNFKITTYNEPKKNLQVFEDDTIRSNTKLNRAKSLQKLNIIDDESINNITPIITPSPIIITTENLYKKTRNEIFKKNEHYNKINRSESFSNKKYEWYSSNKPVTRSKSQIGLTRDENLQNLSKSNSLFNISGLQSLGVMKKIQDKLNTPTASVETLNELQDKVYHTSGPTSINIGTWSDRPKLIKKQNKLINYEDNHKVTIKLNDNSSSINNNNQISNGNVIFKIKGDDHEITTNNHVPIVRSLELKKTLKDSSNSLIKLNDTNSSSNILNYSKFNLRKTIVQPPLQPPPPPQPEYIEKKILNRQYVPINNNNTSVINPRNELLKSIIEFGGKKGLKKVKQI